MKKWFLITFSLILLIMVAPLALASQTIKLIVNGNELETDVPPQLMKGRVLVPIRSVAEALDFEVKWDELNQTVIITKNKPSPELVAKLPEANATLYATLHDGMYERFELRVGEKVRSFPFWKSVSTRTPQLLYQDINRDGNKDIIVLLSTNTGTGVYMSEVHVVQADEFLNEVYVDNPMAIALKRIHSKISMNGVRMTIDDEVTKIKKEKISSKPENWFSELYFGNQITFNVQDNQLKAYLGAQISPTEYVGEIVITYGYKDKMYQAVELEYLAVGSPMK